MKTKPFNDFARLQIEKSMAEAGSKASKMLHARVEELVGILRRKYPIVKIIMGMGGWGFKTKGAKILCEERGMVVDDYATENWLEDSKNDRKRYFYVLSPAPTKADEAALDEIQEILSYLTDEPWLEAKEFKFAN
jgi:predicted Zn-dependent peptidase